MKEFISVLFCSFCLFCLLYFICTPSEKKPYKYNEFDVVETVVGQQIGQIIDRYRKGDKNKYIVRFLSKKEETITNSADIFVKSVLYEEEIKGLK